MYFLRDKAMKEQGKDKKKSDLEKQKSYIYRNIAIYKMPLFLMVAFQAVPTLQPT